MQAHTKDDRFTSWLEDHCGIVVKVARSFATGRDVDDLVQEILLQLWKSTESFKGESTAATWIYRVALNRALTWQRDEGGKAKRTLPVAEVADFAAPDTTTSAHRLRQVYDALRRFPEIDRSLLLLSLDGFTYAEMAAVTGMTETNVGARLSRARKRLSKELEATND